MSPQLLGEWSWLFQAIVPGLALTVIIGYVKLAMRSITTAIGIVAKDIQKSTARIEKSVEKLEQTIESHGTRLGKVERSQAYREGQEAAALSLKLRSAG